MEEAEQTAGHAERGAKTDKSEDSGSESPHNESDYGGNDTRA
jgi:hypothetical protein